jgi:hypothetical protein
VDGHTHARTHTPFLYKSFHLNVFEMVSTQQMKINTSIHDLTPE